jgi:Tat protein secretion system quality control protein TatD with DNase activity
MPESVHFIQGITGNAFFQYLYRPFAAAKGGYLRRQNCLCEKVTEKNLRLRYDRLKDRNIAPVQREVFAAQLGLAAEMGRPVVLHGAKCWGEVVKAVRPYAGRIPAFLFHGFSRSDGLLPDIVEVNGFIGVGKAVLNDHAVNYRELVKKIPLDRLLIETDGEDLPDADRSAILAETFAKTSELTSVTESQIDSNMAVFVSSLAMCR